MNALIGSASIYYRHHKVARLVATLRQYSYIVPAQRAPISSLGCIQKHAVLATSRPPLPPNTLIRQRYYRCSILHLHSTPLSEVWFRFHDAVNYRGQTRCYMSSTVDLTSIPENGKSAIKRLPRDRCKIEFFHSRHDFRDYNERSRGYEDSREDMDDSYHNGIFTVHFHSNVIVKTAVEYYNNNSKLVRQQLEYFTKHTKRWKKFPFDDITKDPEIQYYKGKGSRPIPLRVRSEYEDYDSIDDEIGSLKSNEKVIAIGEEKPKVLEMLSIIKVISERIGRFEFCRSSEDKYTMSSKFINMGAPISISDWLHFQMDIDEELSGIILRQPGALQHITTCFAEFDELWNFEKDPFVDDEVDEMEKYRKRTKPDVRPRGKQKKQRTKMNEKKKAKKKKKTPRPERYNSETFLPF